MAELLGSCHTDEVPFDEKSAAAIMFYADEFADALIAAGIGDVEHERFVFKKAYMDFFIRFNSDKEFRNNFYSVTLGCQIRKFEDMMEKAEKELAEEGKDEQS